MVKKRTVAAEDLYSLQMITGFDLSPDGKNVVYSVRRIDKKKQKKYSNLWVVPTNGGKPKQFTYGDHLDYSPQWSPDGKTIAFLSNRHDERQPQIYLLPFDGGEARPLTSLVGVFGSFEWSPDGKNFVILFRKKDKEMLEREKDELKKKLGIVSRHITRVIFKLDEMGEYVPKEHWHIWTVNAKSGKATQLTSGDVYDEFSPHWSPEGKKIIFCSNRSKDPDFELEVVDVYTIPASGGKLKKIKTPVGYKGDVTISPDGNWVAYYTQVGVGKPWRNIDLCIVPMSGKGDAINLTHDHDITISGSVTCDLPEFPSSTPPTWSMDSKKIYFTVAQHGSVSLRSIDIDSPQSSSKTVFPATGVVGQCTFSKDQSKLVYYKADLGDPGQLWVHTIKTNNSKQLTRLNKQVLQSFDLGKIEELWLDGPDKNKLHCWILKPPSFNPRKKYPSILEIHGGPRMQYGNIFMHEFYFLAAQGYVIYFCNPRGSKGYGEEHAKAIWNNWGTVDFDDIMFWTDYMAKQPYIDTKRMGVTGGSYGGYMTNLIIGRTDRFKAAVSQRSVSNLTSMYGTSDYNWSFQREFGDTPPWENLENYWRQSPLKYIGNAKTPTLVIHSEKDYRASIEQSEQLFVALKKLGVEAEMVLFPDESHGLSRGGRTDRRIERLKHILRWFDKYLK